MGEIKVQEVVEIRYWESVHVVDVSRLLIEKYFVDLNLLAVIQTVYSHGSHRCSS